MLDTDIEKLIAKARSEEGIVFEVGGTKFSLDFNSITRHQINRMHDYHTLDDAIITKIPKMIDVYTYKSASEIIKELELGGWTYSTNHCSYVYVTRQRNYYIPVIFIHRVARKKVYRDPQSVEERMIFYVENPPVDNVTIPASLYNISQEEEK